MNATVSLSELVAGNMSAIKWRYEQGYMNNRVRTSIRGAIFENP